MIDQIIALALVIVALYALGTIGHSCWQIAKRALVVMLIASGTVATMAQATPTPPVPDAYRTQYEATATAAAAAFNFTTNGNQALYNNRPLLPSLNTAQVATTFAYTKWLFSTGAQSIFGPLTPILLSLAGLLLLNMIFMVVYIWQNFIMLAIKAAWWFVSLLIRVIRGG